MDTTKAILARGDGVLIFPEGTRTRPGPLGRPKRGVGRLALETGAPVVPVAIIGSEDVRKGWRIRPHKVRIRAGAPLTFPQVRGAQPPPRRRGDRPHLALRRAPVGVAGRYPARAPRRRHRRRRVGHEPGASRSRAPASRSTSARAPASSRRPPTPLPDAVAVHPAGDIALAHHDLDLPRRPVARAARGGRGAGAEHPRARRRPRALEGPRRAARHAALRVRRRAHARRAPSPASGARAPPPRSSPGATRSSSPAPARPSSARSPTCCASHASTCSARPTSPASSSPAPRATPPSWPPAPPHRPAPARPTPRSTWSSPRSTPTRAVRAAIPRPSPAWRAPATARRRSTTCRCSPSRCGRTGSMPRRWRAWPTSSPAASSPSAGPPR